MRCKKHPYDYSSSVGVCASCLRDRLFALIAAQAQHQHHHHHQLAPDENPARKSDSGHPPPLIFPRSVSPYVSRRKSDERISWSQSDSRHLRFYSTPQVGPAHNSFAVTASPYRKNHASRLSRFSNFFRSRSDKFNPDPTVSSRDSSEPTSSSPSWFSAFFSGRRKKQSGAVSTEYSSTAARKPRWRTDRGMSPGSDEDCGRSPPGSGCSSSESSQVWKKTPGQTIRRGKGSLQTRSVSGLAFCLSPLVRASPSRQWNHKGSLPPDAGLSGEVRIQGKPHLSAAASYCANRSRKLADFGRGSYNR